MARIVPPDLPRSEVLAQLRAQLAAVEQPLRQPPFPVPEVLAGLLPSGGLRPGASYVVDSDPALLAALLAESSQEGHWCAVVGIPEFGIEAAAEAGLELERVVLVPQPGEHWLAVAAALVDVLPLVALRPAGIPGAGPAARLAGRLRDRGAVLLAETDWPRSEARITLSDPQWNGLGNGHGLLQSREVTISVSGPALPQARQTRVVLPDSTGGIRSAAHRLAPAARLRVAG